MSTLKLNNGIGIPQIGFGVFRMPESEQTETAVRGIRLNIIRT